MQEKDPKKGAVPGETSANSGLNDETCATVITETTKSENLDKTVVEDRSSDTEKEAKTVMSKPERAEKPPAEKPPLQESSAAANPQEKKEKVRPQSEAKPEAQAPAGPEKQKTQSKTEGGSMKFLKFLIPVLIIVGVGFYFLTSQQSGQLPDTSRLGSLLPSNQSTTTPPAGQGGTMAAPTNYGQLPAQNPGQGVSPNYDQVQLGMSSDLVRQILGEPLQIKPVGQLIEWEYDTGTGYFEVRFMNSNVVFKGHVAYHATSLQPQTASSASVAPMPSVGQGSVPTGTNYDQIQLGMSPEAVKQILGEPPQVKRVGRLIEWEYDTGSGYFEVRFDQGQTVHKGMTSYHAGGRGETVAPVSTSPGQAVATPAYDKIQVGMTSDMVRQILGEPAEVKRLKNSIEWEYNTPRGIFEVRFQGANVVFRGMAPPQRPKY